MTETALTVQERAINLEARLMKQAEMISQAGFLPAHFRGKPADVFLVLSMAGEMGISKMQALQSFYCISGKIGMSATMMIGLANRNGPFDGPLHFEVTGEGGEMVATCSASIGDKLYETSASMQMAIDCGWVRNKKYQEMPDVMLRYRAASFFVKLYCPEVLGGCQTAEELQDMRYAEAQPVSVEDLTPIPVAAEAVETEATPS